METGRDRLAQIKDEIAFFVVSIFYSDENGEGYIDMIAVEEMEDVDILIMALRNKKDAVLKSRIRTQFDPLDTTMLYEFREGYNVDEVKVKPILKGEVE